MELIIKVTYGENMIYTSYFAKIWKHPGCISIAGKCPELFKGKQYKRLAPKYDFFIKYKNMLKDDVNRDICEKFYTKHYYEEVLNKLDPQQVLNDLLSLSPTPIMTCYEKSGDFCHRHICGKWLHDKTGIEVIELTDADILTLR